MKKALSIGSLLVNAVSCSVLLGLAVFAVLRLYRPSDPGVAARPQVDEATTTHAIASFDAPGAGTGALQGTIAVAINTPGEITGFYYVAGVVAHGFVRAVNSTISDFDAPGAGSGKNQGTFPIGINASGEIAGTYVDSKNVYHGFVRAANGAIAPFDIPGSGKFGHQGTIPFGIDTAGTVAGAYEDTNYVFHGFVLTAAGAVKTFNAPDAGSTDGQGTIPLAISPSGEVTGIYSSSSTGYQGFVRAANGTTTDFQAPDARTGGFGTFPFAINEAGEIAGVYLDTSNASHGFLLTADGTFTKFDVQGAGTSTQRFVLPGTGGLGLNASGEIVGMYGDSKSVAHGFVRAADGSITAFEAPGAGLGKGMLAGTSAFGINTAGAIAGTFADSKSVLHGFVLSAGLPTTTALKSSLNPSVYGRALTLTAQVSSTEGEIPNGDLVSFMKGVTVLGTGSLNDGKATLKTSALPAGADSITAVYEGDPNFAASTSKALSETIGKAASKIALVSSPNPSQLGQSVKFTATVASTTSGTPAGTVTFKNGTATLGTVALSAGKAAYTTSKLAAGTHSIIAEYSGSSDFGASTSAALSQTVK